MNTNNKGISKGKILTTVNITKGNIETQRDNNFVKNQPTKEKEIIPENAIKQTNIATWVTNKKDTEQIGTKQTYISPIIDQRRHTPIAVHNINTSTKQTTLMLQKAISSGSRHGLELKAGKLNAANGD